LCWAVLSIQALLVVVLIALPFGCLAALGVVGARRWLRGWTLDPEERRGLRLQGRQARIERLALRLARWDGA